MKIRFEPVVALPFIEDHLQRSEAERDEAETRVVNASLTELAALEVGRILNKPRRQQERKNADRNIDEENPAPGKVVGDPTAEGRTDGRRHHHRDAINGKCHAPLRRLESVSQNSLLARLQASTARPLKNAKDDQHGEVGRETAQKRADRKQGNAAHVEPLAAD